MVSNYVPIQTYLSSIAREFSNGQLTLIILAAGTAMGKATELANLCRHNFKGLHQLTEIIKIKAINPMNGTTPAVRIILSKLELNKDNKGYLAPLPESEVEEYYTKKKLMRGYNEFMRRNRGRGGKFGYHHEPEHKPKAEHEPDQKPDQEEH